MAQSRYLPLLARWIVAAGVLGFIVIAILYPQRRSEADAYAAAPPCAAADGGCKRLVEAMVLKIDCPWRSSMQACTLKLHMAERELYLALDRGIAERLTIGSALTVESFRGMPTGAMIDGRFVREYGSPEMAMETMRWTVEVWSVLMIAAILYLAWMRKKRGKPE